MQFANKVNKLVVKFIRLEYHEELQAEMLVMERIYPIDYRAYELEIRELWYDVFMDEIRELHQAGFVHRNIKRPSHLSGHVYDNILLTNQGLRLNDVGISALSSQVGHTLFHKFLEVERKELEEFKEYFMNR